jgi:hypothetical protein
MIKKRILATAMLASLCLSAHANVREYVQNWLSTALAVNSFGLFFGGPLAWLTAGTSFTYGITHGSYLKGATRLIPIAALTGATGARIVPIASLSQSWESLTKKNRLDARLDSAMLFSYLAASNQLLGYGIGNIARGISKITMPAIRGVPTIIPGK